MNAPSVKPLGNNNLNLTPKTVGGSGNNNMKYKPAVSDSLLNSFNDNQEASKVSSKSTNKRKKKK